MSQVICWLLNLYFIVLILHVVFSWVPRPPEPILPVVRGVRGLVEPVAAPLRRVIPPLRTGAIAFDLSIIVIFVVLAILQGIFC